VDDILINVNHVTKKQQRFFVDMFGSGSLSVSQDIIKEHKNTKMLLLCH